MTTLKIYIKRLKAKYFFEKTKVPIMEHYCIEEVDQKTTHGLSLIIKMIARALKRKTYYRPIKSEY